MGGKSQLLSWLLPLLPTEGIVHYVEPFGGAANVLINRPVCTLETYSDVNSDLVNFFYVLRERLDELVYAIKCTPYSREEYLKCCSGEYVSELEHARRFYVRTTQSRMALGAQLHDDSVWMWRKTGKLGGTNLNKTQWINRANKLFDVRDRLAHVQIETREALDVIKQVDGKHVLIYCDPPYVNSTRGEAGQEKENCYAEGMTDCDHRILAKRLNACKGKVAVSGRASELYEEIYEGWTVHKAPVRTDNSSGKDAQEVLWTNYKPVTTLSLF